MESRLTPSESVPETLSHSDEEFFQKAFQAYCLSEIHLHQMVMTSYCSFHNVSNNYKPSSCLSAFVYLVFGSTRGATSTATVVCASGTTCNKLFYFRRGGGGGGIDCSSTNAGMVRLSRMSSVSYLS